MTVKYKKRDGVTPKLEVIIGPMFSGKTDQLIERLMRHKIAGRKFQVFKPNIDVRFGKPNKIVSHAGSELEAIRVKTDRPGDILKLTKASTEVVGIEEAQIFSSEIIQVCEKLISLGKLVIVAGLPTDFRGEPFGSMPILLSKAERVDRIHAVCMVCGADADFTQRIVNGKPARYNDPIVIVGASELYEARCRKHHQVPGRPKIK